MMRWLLLILSTIVFASPAIAAPAFASPAFAAPAIAAEAPCLPVAHTNNAVATVSVGGKTYVASFMGLTAGKTWQDVSRQAYVLEVGTTQWQRADVPVDTGRLAATAQGVKEKIYLFGGYTVAADGAETSTPEVFAFDPVSLSYTRLADMPVPVDDSVSFVYKGRYVYLIGGWHDTGNVRTVQIYDTVDNVWLRATDYPGTPVFGHAGGIVGNRFVVADGVAVLGKDAGGRRRFGTVSEGWMGEIDPADMTRITWQRLPQLPGRGHYRMAATGDEKANRVTFTGGTDNAYNYSGVGYNGIPAEPSAHSFAWDFTENTWQLLPDRSVATMDHRGLVRIDDAWLTIGGMVSGQKVTGCLSR